MPLKLLNQSLWWDGPPWLRDPPSAWPPQLPHVASGLPEIQTVMLCEKKPAISSFWSRYSWKRLLRVIAWIYRFVDACTGRRFDSIGLSSEELRVSDERLLILIQKEANLDARMALAQCKSLAKSHVSLLLQPLLDSKCLLHVGGRLENSSLQQCHPILLPKTHPAVDLILGQCSCWPFSIDGSNLS